MDGAHGRGHGQGGYLNFFFLAAFDIFSRMVGEVDGSGRFGVTMEMEGHKEYGIGGNGGSGRPAF